MRARFQIGVAGGTRPYLFQTFWRPGTSGGSVADATDILARVRANLFGARSTWGPGTSAQAVTEVDAIEDTSGLIVAAWTGTDPGVVTGTGSASDALSPAQALIIKSTTALVVGRKLLKGRTYLPGFTEGQSDNNGRPASTLSLWSLGFAGMLTGGTTASFPVVWHRPHPKGATNGTSGPITGYQAQLNYWGVQRRRRF
jgi:hypothetical protein